MSIDDAKKLIDTEKSIRLANLEVEVDIVKADIIFNKYKAFCDGVYQAYQVTNGLFAYPVIKCSGIEDKNTLDLQNYIINSYVEVFKIAKNLMIERGLL